MNYRLLGVSICTTLFIILLWLMFCSASREGQYVYGGSIIGILMMAFIFLVLILKEVMSNNEKQIPNIRRKDSILS